MDIIIPDSVVLELTYECTQKCKFCSCPWENTENAAFFYEKREELSPYEWKKAILKLKRLGVHRFALSGGEPLLKDGFFEILEYIREKGGAFEHKITVITNGELLTREHMAFFKKMNVHLAISLPGLSTYASHTQSVANTAEKVLYQLKLAHAMGIETTVNVTATRENISELYETIGNAFIAGADSLLLNRFLPGGRGLSHMDDLLLSPSQTVRMMDTAAEVLRQAGAYGHLGIEVPLCVTAPGEIVFDENTPRRRLNTRKYRRLSVESVCGAARSFFAIDPSGYLRVCNHSPRRVGSIFGDELVADREYWDMYADKTYAHPAFCNGCDAKDRCDAGCREARLLSGCQQIT